MRLIKIAALTALLALSGASYAHGDESHVGAKSGLVKKEQKDWGIAGDAKAVTRTVEVKMLDSMRFSPDVINVRQGDTVRFVMKNTGKIKHEMVIGTKEELQAHAALMAKFPNMEHDEPYMTHVAPGKTGEVIWTFNRPGEFDFACLMPGHYEVGMVGRIKVAERVASAR